MAAKPKVKIVEHPNKILRKVSDPVTDFDTGLSGLLNDLRKTLRGSEQRGIGLAAVQIGVPKRVILADIARNEPSAGLIEMINPVVLDASEETAIFTEGCLSMPEVWLPICRPRFVTIGYLTNTGQEREEKFSDYCSAVVQHEMDHMDGKLIVDHVSSLRRNLALSKLKKYQSSRFRNIKGV